MDFKSPRTKQVFPLVCPCRMPFVREQLKCVSVHSTGWLVHAKITRHNQYFSCDVDLRPQHTEDLFNNDLWGFCGQSTSNKTKGTHVILTAPTESDTHSNRMFSSHLHSLTLCNMLTFGTNLHLSMQMRWHKDEVRQLISCIEYMYTIQHLLKRVSCPKLAMQDRLIFFLFLSCTKFRHRFFGNFIEWLGEKIQNTNQI